MDQLFQSSRFGPIQGPVIVVDPEWSLVFGREKHHPVHGQPAWIVVFRNDLPIGADNQDCRY